MLQAFLFVGSLSSVMSMELPSYISKCSRNDPHLNDCALQSARESLHRFSLGDPARKLPALDPLYIEEMTVYIPNKQGLKVVFKDNYFHGLSRLHMENLKFDLDKKTISADAMVTLDVINRYELTGKLLMIPLESKGDSEVNLINTLLHIRLWYEHVDGPDGKVHWKITKNDIKYEVERAHFRLDNLLNDKNIADQVNKLLNELWREVTAEVGPVIRTSLGNAVMDNLAVLLEQVSYDELMPEKL